MKVLTFISIFLLSFYKIHIVMKRCLRCILEVSYCLYWDSKHSTFSSGFRSESKSCFSLPWCLKHVSAEDSASLLKRRLKRLWVNVNACTPSKFMHPLPFHKWQQLPAFLPLVCSSSSPWTEDATVGHRISPLCLRIYVFMFICDTPSCLLLFLYSTCLKFQQCRGNNRQRDMH